MDSSSVAVSIRFAKRVSFIEALIFSTSSIYRVDRIGLSIRMGSDTGLADWVFSSYSPVG